MQSRNLEAFARATLGAAAGAAAGGWATVLADYLTFNSWFFTPHGDRFEQQIGWIFVAFMILLAPSLGALLGAWFAGDGGCGSTIGAAAAAWVSWALWMVIWTVGLGSADLKLPAFSVLVGGPLGAFGLVGILLGVARLRRRHE